MNTVQQNLRRVVIVDAIDRDGLYGVSRTIWDQPGIWREDGKLFSGLVEKSSDIRLKWFSMVEAQNYADAINAEFTNLFPLRRL